MAEIDLVSSHTPWTPLPRMVRWDAVGDGSVYDGMPAQGPAPAAVWRDPAKVQAAYGQSIQYSLTSLISFVQTSHDKNLVLVVLGDHQPRAIVSGRTRATTCRSRSSPTTRPCCGRIAGWGWQDGPAARAEGTGLADGRVPQPVPHRVRRIGAIIGT